MAMVIPNGILNNPRLAYVRQWILANAELLAVVDMQRDLFQPKNDTQTSMVLLRRLSEEEKRTAEERDYPVFLAVTDKIGHDKRGNAIYKRDVTGEDILKTYKIPITAIEEGKPVQKVMEEVRLVIDDQLPEIPSLYREWCGDHGR